MNEFEAWLERLELPADGGELRLEPWQRALARAFYGVPEEELPPVRVQSCGRRPSLVILDEIGSSAPRRELVAVRPDGSSYVLNVPATLDVAEALDPGDTIAAELELEEPGQ